MLQGQAAGDRIRAARRVHVVGMAGSGKTTLARRLAARIPAPRYELDAIGYEGGAGAKRSHEARQGDIARIVAQPAWVTEGVFLWWVGDLLRHADAIVWLDLHWWVCYRHILLRHVRADLARNNRHPGYANLLRFAGGVRPYYLKPAPAAPPGADSDAASRAATAQVLSPYADKVARCRRPAEVKRLLAGMQAA